MNEHKIEEHNIKREDSLESFFSQPFKLIFFKCHATSRSLFNGKNKKRFVKRLAIFQKKHFQYIPP